MSDYIRLRRPGATIFFTVSLAQPGTTLLVDEIDRLRAAVGLTRRARPFDVRAWVVLPDHLHCIWTLPDGDADYATRWRQIKTRFSRGLPRQITTASQLARAERGIWQRRYWEHHIRSQADLRQHQALCRAAPVRAGLVDRAEDWPFSQENRRKVGCVLARTAPPALMALADRPIPN